MTEKQSHNVPRILAAIAVVTVLFVGLLVATSYVTYPKNNSPEAGMIEAAANGAAGEPESTLDVLFVGDSEVIAAISPLLIYNDFGFTSYDCASPSQNLAYSNTILHRAFETQKPRIVVFTVNMAYTPFGYGDAAMRTLADVFPVIEFHSRWKSLTTEDFGAPIQTTWSDDLKGFLIRDIVDPAENDGPSTEGTDVLNLARLNAFYLKSMFDFCRSNGAEPVLVALPSTKNWNSAKHNGIAAFAEEQNVTFIDMNKGATKHDVNWKTETRDGGDHLNYRGAVRATRFLARKLTERFDLPDHRNDPAYSSWDEAYARYAEMVPSDKKK